jgi:hypothetical protein
MGILPGSHLADLWTPTGVTFETWANFIDITGIILIFVVAVFFLLFPGKKIPLFPRPLSYRLTKLKEPHDVFQLSQTWIYGLFFIFLAQLFLGVFLGLILLPNNSSAIAGTLALVTAEGLFGMLLYWFVSMWPTLPKRIKYTPWGKDRIYTLIGRKK